MGRSLSDTGRRGGRGVCALVVAAWLCAWAIAPASGQQAAAEQPTGGASEAVEQPSEEAAVEEAVPGEVRYDIRQLQRDMYQLSHMEAKRCLEVLKSLGYTTGPPQGPLPLSLLPAIFALPDTEADSVVATTDKLNPSTDASPQQRLMILYHESQAADVAALRKLLADQIDVPCREVLIEALFIELSQSAARELGFNYDISCAAATLTFKPDEGGEIPYLTVVAKRLYEGVTPNAQKFEVTLKAMIDERTAEVLSSPSVLTLDGRQARITVSQEVPIIQSTTVTGGTTTLNVTFKQVGITLNIKPRVTDEGDWVTLQIQTEVSEAPLEDYIMVGGEPVAPLISSRKVETIARIRNNTPFIVGGLIRNERGGQVARIPLLSSIPILGNLFMVRSDRDEKREVIIVLTPRVMELAGSNRPLLPKDSERFDFLDNRLFRNSYRLKAEDVFDLGFITENKDVAQTFQAARRFLEAHPEYRQKPPFDVVESGGIPGEEAIVIRMIYEVTRKLELQESVALDRLIYFAPAPEKPAGFKVTFLSETLGALAGHRTVMDHLDRDYPKDVLLLQYELRREGEGGGDLLAPVATVVTKRVESRKEAERLLYEYSKSEGYRRTRAAILIAGPQDLDRLRAAVAVREVLDVNNVEALLNLANFQVGRRIAMPELDPSGERIFLICDRVADLFYQSDFYYEAFQERFRAYYDGIREILAGQGK